MAKRKKMRHFQSIVQAILPIKKNTSGEQHSCKQNVPDLQPRRTEHTNPAATATFLGLPRELRDIIYSHLSHSVTLLWHADPRAYEGLRYAPSRVRFDNVPLPQVFRLNSQIHAEYTEASRFRDISITTKLSNRNRSWDHFIPVKWNWIHTGLGFARHATFILPCLPSGGYKDIFSSLRVFQSIYPHISTIKIAVRKELAHPHRIYHMDLLEGEVQYPALTRRSFLPDPPTRVANFPLVQRGEGYRIVFSYCCSADRVLSTHLAISHVIPGRQFVCFYSLVAYSVLLYGSCEETHQKYWEPSQVLELWPEGMDIKRSRLLGSASEEEDEIIIPLLQNMHEWKERRGNEIMKWDTPEAGNEVGLGSGA